MMPPTLEQVRAVMTQMMGNASDQVRLAPTLQEMVRQLPPPGGELLSRYQFDRAGLYSLCTNFYWLAEDAVRSQVIRCPKDMWIRSVHVFVMPSLVFAEPPPSADLLLAAQQRALLCNYGTNWRCLVDVAWRLGGKQGFITDTKGDLLAPAAQVSGDGEFPAYLDWKLEREDTIIVKVHNRIDRTISAECVTDIYRTLKWICVAFWAEATDV